ncbi:uncharacterized protein LOC128450331 [Pleuronectes platessa]|uniref:uncharacterized protein LOC128450331 n=1 Tax=Pleuronectes platessa TaxID=8262 RepID=UPI00232A25EA|nr:uncharacterized protein LOC128450331 [Pleuronectes platessa]
MAQTFYGKPGDLIEISRELYQHWAVYIGGKEVVHFTTVGGRLLSTKAKVKCEKLTDVVRDDCYQVNNLLDEEYQPRDPSIIVKKAREMVGQVLPYKVVTYNSEHFAIDLRYGKAKFRQFNGEPGDLIEINRGPYQHWAVYIGENEVIHLVTEGVQSSGSSATLSSSNGKVKCEKFNDVVGNHHYQVNNLLDEEYDARDPSVIVKEACEMVDRVPQYDLVTYNSQHFATDLRYGKAESRQFNGKPGDLIQIFRNRFYEHWAVYIGKDEVVHLVPEGDKWYDSFKSLSISSSSSTGKEFRQTLIDVIGQKRYNELLECMNQTCECKMDGNYDDTKLKNFLEVLISETGRVKREKLADVVKDDRYQINNLLDEEHTTLYPSFIVKRALEMVGRELKNNIFTYNCEHFATEMRYDKAVSRQIQEAALIFGLNAKLPRSLEPQ